MARSMRRRAEAETFNARREPPADFGRLPGEPPRRPLTMLRRVVVESPYAGNIDRNLAYARRAIRDALERGEAPIASHLLFTQPGILRDENPDERRLGIEAGFAWMECAELVALYTDYGISAGMQGALERAAALGITTTERKIGPNP